MRGTPIRIAVVFQPGVKAKPIWFELDRKQHRIVETTYFWKDKAGETPLLHYAVITDSNALYELIYNTSDQNWTLVHQQDE